MERASLSTTPTDRSPRNGRIVMISIGERKRSATGCDHPSSLFQLSLSLSLLTDIIVQAGTKNNFPSPVFPQFTNINPRDVDNR